MSYSFVTLTQAQADLQGRLYNLTADTTQQFWTLSELTLYIQEALRTWQALTSFFRGDFTFGLSQGTWWYDITTQVGSLRAMTLRDFDLLQVMEAHLLEPLSGSYPLSWGGSGQFALSDLLGALERKRDEVLASTLCTLSRSTVTASTSQARTTLSDSIMLLRRVAWIPGTGSPVALDQSDLETKGDFDYLFGGAGTPTQWMQSTEPALSFDVDYIPQVAGNYELLTVNAGGALVTTSATVLGVPDDWAWVVKWGALSSLLARESDGKDPLRAAYCEKRYQEGLRLLRGASSVLRVLVGTTPVSVDSVRNGDNFNANWQALAQANPSAVYSAGLNLLGVAPAPGAVSPGLTLTVVSNATVPSAGGDFLQVGRDDYDVVLDYAQHLATFKMGGREFEETLPLYQAFLGQASLYNSALGQEGFFQRPIYEIGKLEEKDNPPFGAEAE